MQKERSRNLQRFPYNFAQYENVCTRRANLHEAWEERRGSSELNGSQSPHRPQGPEHQSGMSSLLRQGTQDDLEGPHPGEERADSP